MHWNKYLQLFIYLLCKQQLKYPMIKVIDQSICIMFRHLQLDIFVYSIEIKLVHICKIRYKLMFYIVFQYQYFYSSFDLFTTRNTTSLLEIHLKLFNLNQVGSIWNFYSANQASISHLHHCYKNSKGHATVFSFVRIIQYLHNCTSPFLRDFIFITVLSKNWRERTVTQNKSVFYSTALSGTLHALFHHFIPRDPVEPLNRLYKLDVAHHRHSILRSPYREVSVSHSVPSYSIGRPIISVIGTAKILRGR